MNDHQLICIMATLIKISSRYLGVTGNSQQPQIEYTLSDAKAVEMAKNIQNAAQQYRAV
jgi:hypothetical protein